MGIDETDVPPWRLYLLCLSIATLLQASCYGLDRYGRESRRLGQPRLVGAEGVTPLLVATPQEAYGAWRRGGYRGRTILFIADGWDRLDPSRFSEPEPHLAYPIKTYRIADRIESHFLEARTFLYLASLQGVARRIVAVLSPEDFARERELALRAKNARVDEDTVYLTHQGFPRWFASLAGLPPQDEPVLLYVAASAFRSYRPGQLLGALRAKGIRSDAAVLCTLAGEPGVTERERLDLHEFAGLLQRGGT